MALLDVNFLLGLMWPQHQFARQARTWFQRHRSKGWATCTLTQLGFIRLSSNPAYLQGMSKTPDEARQILIELTEDSHHHFLPDSQGPLHFPEIGRILGHQQLTDAYLVGLARQANARFVTFDRRVGGLSLDETQIETLNAGD